MPKLDPKMRAAWAKGLRLARNHDPLALTGKRPRWQYIRERWDDHGESWTRNRRHVAYTSHVYDEPKRADLETYCRTHGLTFEIHPPAESWYYPGSTWLVILWAAGAAPATAP